MGSLEEEAKEEMKQAGQRLRKLILDENPEQANDDVLDVAVTFDGTWAKRGFTLLTGVVFVISVDSGEVLDYHVLSKVCQICAIKKVKVTEEEFEQWLLAHECDINFVGSSPAMESEVRRGRSIETHNMSEVYIPSEGDVRDNTYQDEIRSDTDSMCWSPSFSTCQHIFAQATLTPVGYVILWWFISGGSCSDGASGSSSCCNFLGSECAPPIPHWLGLQRLQVVS
ncbi:Hypothetical predicted protein [Paramuricea clavata]|uniref:Mutator-like transposase domain-containing protein n=1 Tax=Paramuricea clavata TaxID=317549 RepID=A0A6S7G0I3_PARCT|nr:Hypothetical predicted protein [Paramuricea clavata]